MVGRKEDSETIVIEMHPEEAEEVRELIECGLEQSECADADESAAGGLLLLLEELLS